MVRVNGNSQPTSEPTSLTALDSRYDNSGQLIIASDLTENFNEKRKLSRNLSLNENDTAKCPVNSYFFSMRGTHTEQTRGPPPSPTLPEMTKPISHPKLNDTNQLSLFPTAHELVTAMYFCCFSSFHLTTYHYHCRHFFLNFLIFFLFFFDFFYPLTWPKRHWKIKKI